jgi:hypothetical protein
VIGEGLARREGDMLIARSSDPAGLNYALVNAGVRVTELIVARRSLEDVFLELTETAEVPQ